MFLKAVCYTDVDWSDAFPYVETGLEVLAVQRVSKAQAWQRTGRAGREDSGVCYRLYTEDEFEKFDKMTIPEIQRWVQNTSFMCCDRWSCVKNWTTKLDLGSDWLTFEKNELWRCLNRKTRKHLLRVVSWNLSLQTHMGNSPLDFPPNLGLVSYPSWFRK